MAQNIISQKDLNRLSNKLEKLNITLETLEQNLFTIENFTLLSTDFLKNKSLKGFHIVDIESFLFHCDFIVWNLKGLGSILPKNNVKISFGLIGFTFACYVENNNMGSINYLHTGDPKT